MPPKKGSPKKAAAAGASANGSGQTARAPRPEPLPATTSVLTEELQKLSLDGRIGNKLAIKPKSADFGPKQKVTLVTNLFRLEVHDRSAYHYDITFRFKKTAKAGRTDTKKKEKESSASGDSGDVAPAVYGDPLIIKRITKILFEKMRKTCAVFATPRLTTRKPIRAVFDGMRNMYTMEEMLVPDEAILDFECEIDDETRGVRAEYKYTGHVVNLVLNQNFDRDSLQVLDIGVGFEAATQYINRSNRYFDRENPPKALGMNLELRFGFIKSVKTTESGLYVNLDRAAAVFQKGGRMTDVVINVLEMNRPNSNVIASLTMTPDLKARLEGQLKGLRFLCHNAKLGYSQKCKFEKVSLERVDRLRFRWKDTVNGQAIDRDISVYDYFKQKYDIQLKYPNLPCLQVKKGENITSMPLENCFLPPEQYYEKKMLVNIQKQVTQATVQAPTKRFQEIKESMGKLQTLSKQIVDCKINLEPQEVTGWIIPAPMMSFAGAREQQVMVNSVDAVRGNPCDFRGNEFIAKENLERWTIVQVSEGRSRFPNVSEQLRKFGHTLAQTAVSKGWKVQAPGERVFEYHPATAHADLKKFMHGAKLVAKQQLLLFAIPDSGEVYEDIKKVSNEEGMVTQCLKTSNQAKASSPTFVSNMLQKMNAKLGGINAKLAPVSKPEFLQKNCTMILGMDVFHPGPGSAQHESIAGFVCSYTADYTKYMHQARAQRQVDDGRGDFKRVEEINDAVKPVMIDFLNRFMSKNKRFPSAILVFRDGVSEGQFEKVRLIELKQIYDAMDQLGVKAKVTFITVQKRHHFRMFAKDSAGNVANPKPGTLIDSQIVHPTRFEGYLNSHHALQGTSKPSYYCVIHNQCDLSSNELWKISYYLCYLCARCYKPISIPIPVKYAHLVAEKAAQNLASAMRNRLPGSTDDKIRVHEEFLDKLVYA